LPLGAEHDTQVNPTQGVGADLHPAGPETIDNAPRLAQLGSAPYQDEGRIRRGLGVAVVHDIIPRVPEQASGAASQAGATGPVQDLDQNPAIGPTGGDLSFGRTARPATRGEQDQQKNQESW